MKSNFKTKIKNLLFIVLIVFLIVPFIFYIFDYINLYKEGFNSTTIDSLRTEADENNYSNSKIAIDVANSKEEINGKLFFPVRIRSKVGPIKKVNIVFNKPLNKQFQLQWGGGVGFINMQNSATLMQEARINSTLSSSNNIDFSYTDDNNTNDTKKWQDLIYIDNIDKPIINKDETYIIAGNNPKITYNIENDPNMFGNVEELQQDSGEIISSSALHFKQIFKDGRTHIQLRFQEPNIKLIFMKFHFENNLPSLQGNDISFDSILNSWTKIISGTDITLSNISTEGNNPIHSSDNTTFIDLFSFTTSSNKLDKNRKNLQGHTIGAIDELTNIENKKMVTDYYLEIDEPPVAEEDSQDAVYDASIIAGQFQELASKIDDNTNMMRAYLLEGKSGDGSSSDPVYYNIG